MGSVSTMVFASYLWNDYKKKKNRAVKYKAETIFFLNLKEKISNYMKNAT